MEFKNKTQNHIIDLLFTLALFCVFAATSLAVVIIGANVYKNTVSKMDNNFRVRTSAAYISEKIRQNDKVGAVYVSQIQKEPALVLEQEHEENIYQTWIYSYEGTLREVFTEKGTDILPSDGQEIMQIQDLEIRKLLDNLIEFSVIGEDGKTTTQLICLRST